MLEITVIIPTYNRCEILDVTLASLASIAANNLSWEIIVVDNNSNDNTQRIVHRFEDVLPIKYLSEKKQGKNFALNAAISIAQGAILVFADDDILVDKNWLTEIYSSTQRYPERKVFGGKIIPLFPEGTPQWMKTSDYSNFVYGIHDPPQGEGAYLNSGTPGGANCWVLRSIFDDGNRYDVDIGPKGTGRISGSELEFFTRLLRGGVEPVYIPSAVVLHRIQQFQTQKKYLLKRSYSSGLGFIHIFGSYTGPKMFGVPRFLFKQIWESFLKAVLSILSFDIKSCFEHLMAVAHRLGCVKQYRIKRNA